MKRSFKELVNEGVPFIENLFRVLDHNKIVEQLQVLGNFSRIFEQEDNQRMVH